MKRLSHLTLAAPGAAALIARVIRAALVALIVLVAFVALAVPGFAGQAGAIEIVPEYAPETEFGQSITLEDFRRRFSLDILITDPRTLSGEALLALAGQLDLATPLGRPLVDLFAAPGTGDLIGVGGGRIDLVGTLPHGGLVVTTRDEDGAYSPAEPGNVGWFGPGGERRCFEPVPIGESGAPMHFTLLLDRSGSMSGEMDAVLALTAEFLEALPVNAQCMVASFNDELTVHTGGASQPCGAAAAPRALSAGGGTDIYSPLGDAFARYAGPPYAAGQRAVIIVTDGADTAHGDTAGEVRAGLLAAKGDTRVIVAWLGSHTGEYLADLADYSLTREGEVAEFLSGVYGVLEQAYGTQTVLRPVACPAPKAAGQ